MWGFNINYFYTGININQRTQYYHANKNTKEWERWNSNPIFPIESTNSLNCFLVNHCHYNKSKSNSYKEKEDLTTWRKEIFIK